jgi:hypothetical protein
MHLTCPIGHKEKDTPTHASILPEDIPLEFSVLLSACRVFLGTEETSCLEALLQQGPDWDRLLALSNRHGVMPLLYRSLGRVDRQLVPQEQMARLRVLYMQNAARNIRMTGELLRILDLFEARGIQAIPFKGPALTQQIYGDITLRSFVDLDIIVHRKDVLRTKEILVSEDYRPEVELNPSQEKVFIASECEYNFNHKARGVRVEVHWRINPSCYCIDFDVEDVWPRANSAQLEGKEVSTLSPEDQLISLCIHGARHNWKEMKHICDVAGLAGGKNNLNWKKVISYARKRHIEGILLLGLMLAEGLFRIQLPEEASSRLAQNFALQALALQLQHDLHADYEGSSRLMDETIFWFKTRERLQDSLNCIIRLAIEPTPIDLMKTPLPIQLYPLYYLIHPARLLMQYGRRKEDAECA